MLESDRGAIALRHEPVVLVRHARAAEARVADPERQLKGVPGNPHNADHRLAHLIERRRVTPFAVALVLKIRVTDVEVLAARRLGLAKGPWKRLWAGVGR